MDCKHSERKENKIYCKLIKNICHLAYWCQDDGKWKNFDNLDKRCNLYKEMEDKEYLKYGQYKVLYRKRKFLCVKINENETIFVENIFGDKYPIGVNLEKINGKYFIK